MIAGLEPSEYLVADTGFFKSLRRITELQMAYRRDLAKSARRHLAAAKCLYACADPSASSGMKAVAGYLFGLAGELALKQIMTESGMRELSSSERREDPMYAHFPTLKTLLGNMAQGRRQGELLKYAKDPQLFDGWNTDMRYAPTADIPEARTAAWKLQAEKLVQEMGY